MIGNEPVLDEWIITKGQDLTYLFETTDDEPFPDDTELTVYALAAQDTSKVLGLWSAVDYQPGAIQIQIDAEDLDPIPDGSQFRVYLKYPDSPRVCWYRGRMWRRD